MTSLPSAADPDPWWRDPRGWVAMGTILTMVLGFFYVRERQMWEQSAAIKGVEARGAAAILEYKTEHEKLVLKVLALERDLWNLESRIGKEEKRGNRRDEKEATPPY